MIKIVLLLFLTQALAYRFAVFTDIHLDPLYDPNVSLNYCQTNINATQDPTYAPLGRMSCDPPLQLLQSTLQFAKQENTNKPFDAILIPGDLVGHGIPLKPNSNNSEGNYTLLKETINSVMQTVEQVFPNTMILGSLGNNDAEYHYQAPSDSEKNQYYNFIYEAFWQNISANSKLNQAQVKQTMLNGGYYRVDFAERLSFLCLNSLYYNIQNNATDLENVSEQQLNWFESELSSSPSTKFIIQYHIYAGAHYDNGPEATWYDKYNLIFFNILKQYKDSIVIEITGHDHISDLRYLKSKDEDGNEFNYHNMWLSPSISPIFGNQPGYSIVTIDENSLIPIDIEEFFFDLQSTYNTTLTSVPLQNKLSYAENFGIQDITPDSINNFNNVLYGNNNFAIEYLATHMGCDSNQIKECIQKFFVDFGGMMTENSNDISRYLCLMEENDSITQLENCVQEAEEFQDRL